MWMNTNLLKVNEDKTVALVHALRKKRRNITVGPTAFKIVDCDMTPSPCPNARNIGVGFDAEMLMASRIHQTFNVYYNIASIQKCLISKPQFASCIILGMSLYLASSFPFVRGAALSQLFHRLICESFPPSSVSCLLLISVFLLSCRPHISLNTVLPSQPWSPSSPPALLT